MKKILAIALSALVLLSVPCNALAAGEDISADDTAKSTAELLADYIGSDEVLLSAAVKNFPHVRDLSGDDGFKELITRDDLPDALEAYAELMSSPDYVSPFLNYEKDAFGDIIRQWAVIDTVNDAVVSDSSQYPALRKMYSSYDIDLTSAVQSFTLYNITYTRTGSVQTADGRSVDAYTAQRQLTDSEISNLNMLGATVYGATRVGSPAANYNRHSFAWYKASSSNPYWIRSADKFITDSECTYISSGTTSKSVQVNDIIVYYDSSGNAIHSGIITAVTSDGVLTVKSKWGQGGIYVHSVNAVPSSYRPQGSSTTRTKIYRYHDYKYQYTGQNYHQGSRHYFQYATKCTVCFAQKGEAVWKFKACSGSPCVLPASVPDMAS